MSSRHHGKEKQSQRVIGAASVASAAIGAGLAQVPLSDSALLIPIQIAMIVAVGRKYGIAPSKSLSFALTSGVTATYFGRATSRIVGGWIPGFGNAINAATAASMTEAIGLLSIEYFKSLEACDPDKE